VSATTRRNNVADDLAAALDNIGCINDSRWIGFTIWMHDNDNNNNNNNNQGYTTLTRTHTQKD